MTSAISCPLWSSVYECQRVECASPVRIECGMFVMCCMSVSRGGIYMFAIVMCLVLLICTVKLPQFSYSENPITQCYYYSII